MHKERNRKRFKINKHNYICCFEPFVIQKFSSITKWMNQTANQSSLYFLCFCRCIHLYFSWTCNTPLVLKRSHNNRLLTKIINIWIFFLFLYLWSNFSILIWQIFSIEYLQKTFNIQDFQITCNEFTNKSLIYTI